MIDKNNQAWFSGDRSLINVEHLPQPGVYTPLHSIFFNEWPCIQCHRNFGKWSRHWRRIQRALPGQHIFDGHYTIFKVCRNNNREAFQCKQMMNIATFIWKPNRNSAYCWNRQTYWIEQPHKAATVVSAVGLVGKSQLLTIGKRKYYAVN